MKDWLLNALAVLVFVVLGAVYGIFTGLREIAEEAFDWAAMRLHAYWAVRRLDRSCGVDEEPTE